MSGKPKYLSNDYKKQGGTYTDNLTEEEIEKLLEDYKQVDDIYKVPLNTHLRYFTVINGDRKFRMGGSLIHTQGLPNYIKLSNGSHQWSVQVKNAIFFSKMTLAEIKADYEKEIHYLKKKIDGLRNIIQKVKNGEDIHKIEAKMKKKRSK